ncbi:MAG: hypothetical protein WBL25_17470 [Anaerolineales bacterium]
MSENPVSPVNGVYTLYEEGTTKVTLTFPANSHAGFTVVTKDVPTSGLDTTNYTWLFNFGIKNKAGHFLPSVSYHLNGTSRSDGKSWFVFYNGRAHGLNGNHTSPGDPPVGYG